MTDYPIPASAIGAAARALRVAIGGAAASLLAAETSKRDLSGELAEKTLRAAFDELGMGREERRQWTDTYERLVSRWMPAEEWNDKAEALLREHGRLK